MQTIAQLVSELTSLGFSDHDARVYLALLKHGPCKAGPLIRATGFHRNIVYTSLAHLTDRKLATEKVVRGIKQFEPVDPQQLTNEFRQKEERSAQIVNTLRTFQSKSRIDEITVHQGNDEYLTLLTGLLRQLPKGATKYVIGTGGEAFMQATMRPIWQPYHLAAVARNIHIKMIAYESQRDALTEDIKHPPIYSVRYLSDAIENPAGLHIYPEAETVLNILYSDTETPVTAIKLVSPRLVRGYLHLFKNLWQLAKN